MENQILETEKDKSISRWQVILNIVLFLVLIILIPVYSVENKNKLNQQTLIKESQNIESEPQEISLINEVLPKEGVVLPVRWGDLGKKLIEAGVIDPQKFEALYTQRGGLSEEAKNLLYGENNGNLVINDQNNGLILNLLWAFGLANKNSILENGPMTDPRYGGAGVFASTGGWTLAVDNAMNHYSKHSFVVLNSEQQKLVEKVSQNIYRPCCNNSTYFPDCNHGMAMLGLLELLASQGASEEELYKVALQVNAYWFPDTYLTIAKYFKNRNISWQNVNPKEVLGFDFSSASGYRRVLSLVEPIQIQSGGSCGV